MKALDEVISRNTYRAKWAPIYIEPLSHSGEKLTCGIAAIGDDGEVCVVSAFILDSLIKFFGEAGRELYNISTLVLADIEAHLKENREIQNWMPALRGVSKGAIYISQDADIKAIAKQALYNMASFSAKQAEREMDEIDDDKANTEWRKDIRNFVSEMKPSLKNQFDNIVKISGFNLKIGFAGQNLAANFSKINPSNIDQSIQHAKARIFDLEQLRVFTGDIGFKHHELIILDPSGVETNLTPSQRQRLGNGRKQLEGFCSKHKIELIGTDSARKAADHICSREAA